ncbi:uncharacterized protein Z518_10362 [Rhinocladiella mackenziei CBS 650.93]|uniref:Amidohydrolase-related domain-containing protein n=1 Tax=Rhinocladiella mackenziei CBS 650.93 TaxID=1442369 RepID=A0A0D2GPD7_9EURO|nr:uncharacterized protein Z518_10362 [Rhinocladiella mackenziei CBS 650.93]KIX00223.1 hypothetical protein Z518_10362 [Rhinocladiella mackenziei CBS 650.93]
MAATSSILLKGGTVLQHQADDKVAALKDTDILIQGNKIASIGASLATPPNAQIIDCTGKLVSPGMIDTHNHLWLTQLKARHAEQTLFEYMYTGNLQSFNFDADDIFWGQLGGCLEAIDAGTTTVVDHAHLTYSTEHVNKALGATIASGLRCFFCYVPIMRLKQWEPLTPDMDFLPGWLLSQLERLAKTQPFGKGRVMLGFGYDLWALPKDKVVELWGKVRDWGVKLLTTHYCRNRIFGLRSVPGLLKEYGLLKPDVIVAHATQASLDDGKMMTEAGVYVAVTPESEGQMALGRPLTFRDDVQTSLGVDCHFIGPSDLPSQMRLALQLERQTHNQAILDADKYPLTNVSSSTFVYNLGTIVGARAVKMEDQIGSTAVGKLADLVIYDATSPTMVCAAQADPVTAIVRHSTIRDVETVIVDGVVRKLGGKLVPISMRMETGEGDFAPPAGVSSSEPVDWAYVAKAIMESREKVVAKIDALNMEAGAQGVMKAFAIDENKLVR